MTSGMVKTRRIGQSAAKPLSAPLLGHMGKVQRLSGDGAFLGLKIESCPTERWIYVQRVLTALPKSWRNQKDERTLPSGVEVKERWV